MIKNILIFVSGLIVGGITTYSAMRLVLEDKYHKFADDEIEEMRKYYEGLLEDQICDRDDDETPPEPIHFERFMTKPEELAEEAKEHLDNALKTSGTVDYKSFYDPAESESPEEDSDDIEVEMETFHRLHKGKSPKIISMEAAGNLPAGIDHQILYFYTLDDEVADEENNAIIDYERLIGNSLDEYDFRESEETIIFVLNYELDVCFEIQKVEDSWGESYGREEYD